MPTLPPSLTNPGLLLALCLIVGLVVGVNATLVTLLRRGSGGRDGDQWSRALGAGREQQRRQSAQLDELHRMVSELSTGRPNPQKPNE
jgi:hypothetical protein